MGNPLPVIALVATGGMCDFLFNTLSGITRCGIEPSRVVVGCPTPHYEQVNAVAKEFNVEVKRIDLHFNLQMPLTPLEFKSEGFKEVQWLKIRLVRMLLENNERLIYSDLDIAWLRDPSKYLQSVLDCYPIAFQSEAQAIFPPAVCAGFMAFRRSEPSLTFLDAMLAEDYEKNPVELRNSDQPVAQRLLNSNPHWLRETFVLPERLFPNGLSLALVNRKQPQLSVEPEVQPFIFHANWLVGADAKRKVLHSLGVWSDSSAYLQTNQTTPTITVLFPMFDLRFDAAEAVRGWTTGQTADQTAYRVVVIAGPESASMIPAVRAQLRQVDAIIEVPVSGNEVDYWLAGAQATSSPWLLHVEAHTRPDRDCIRQIIDWIRAHPETEALNCTITNPPTHNVSKLMESWFRKVQLSWADPGTWSRLHRTAFALRRDILQGSTVLQSRYGLFAPALLSARLHAKSRRVVTLSDARVGHEDSMMKQHQLDTVNYVEGELQAFRDENFHLMATYFGSRPEERLNLMDSHDARTYLNNALQSMARGNIRNLRASFYTLTVLACRSLSSSGSAISLRRKWATFIGWVIETVPLPHHLRLRLFVRDHKRVVTTEQLVWYRNHGRSGGAVRDAETSHKIKDLEPGSILGVHDLELHNETTFRWTEPLFFLRILIPQGTWIIRLDLMTIRARVQPQHMFATFGKRRINRIYSGENCLEFTINSERVGEQYLMVSIPALRESGPHPRRLGLPLVAVSIRSETSFAEDSVIRTP